MHRGSRRLLNDLLAFGRLYDARPPAAERLRQEVGPELMNKLLAPAEGTASSRSAGRRRRVA